MKIDFNKIPSRLERAVLWRLERFLKKRNKNNKSRGVASLKKSVFRTTWGESWYNEPVQDTKIFYEAFSGNNALCNPLAIFERLLEREDFADYRHVWSVANESIKDDFDAQYRDNPRVSSVVYESVKYYRELSTAKYLFNNATFQPAFAKRRNQIYVNTWHGTPLKKMGYELPGGARVSANILRNFASSDYILSPNAFTTETMLRNAYRLQGIFEGRVIEEGYPRIDVQFGDEVTRGNTRAALRSQGLTIRENKTVVVYAPTWKGKTFHSPEDESTELLERIDALKHRLGTDYQLFLKVHQRVYDSAVKIPSLENYLVPNSIATNKVLGITDILITDYSSIFFDFLATDRPVLFHTPDRIEYGSTRGFYIELEDLPGPTSHSLQELVTQIESIGTGKISDPVVSHRDAYEKARALYCPHDDGGASDRVIDIVFDKNNSLSDLIDMSECKKIKLLIFLGGMKANGITSAALNLLENMDYDRFDVSVMVPKATNDSNVDLYDMIHPNARVFIRSNTFPATEAHLIEFETFLSEKGCSEPEMPPLVSQLFNAEWHRLFGDSHFDHIVDFSGYGGFWSYILLEGNAKTHSVWLHSNLRADAEKIIDGNAINRNALYSQFRAYEYFDSLISVSPTLSEINYNELSEYAPKSKFRHVSNTLNLQKLAAGSRTPAESPANNSARPAEGVLLGDLIRELSSLFSWEDISESVTALRRYDEIFPDPEKYTTFITVGRLSPEKNHERLLRAFSRVHAEFPDSRLLIAGAGPTEDELVSLMSELDLSHSVSLLGHVDDGLELMRRSDCFVMSSDYEGQPMAILEARSVNLPVLTVEFGSVASVLGHDEGLIVQMSVDGLADGMKQFILDGEIPTRPFDPVEFNDCAMAGFYEVING